MSLEEFDAWWQVQLGRCMICKEVMLPPGGGNVSTRCVCVDHDHTTGAVRSLLCSACNRGLGFFNDNPDLLRRAADYLAYKEDQRG